MRVAGFGYPSRARSQWFCRHSAQTCCPFNITFAQELKEPSFAARETLAERDARTLAREILQMTPEEFSRAFKGSPMNRAKLRGLKRNAAVVLGNVGTSEDVDVLTRALDGDEPLVREHAAWALRQLDGERTAPPRSFSDAGGSELQRVADVRR